jgi:rod shape-determining protein MreD
MSGVVKAVLGLLLATAGQFLLYRYLPTVGHRVDLYTILVIYHAVNRRRVGGMVVGSAAGLIQDLLGHTVLGINAFKKTLVGYLIGALGSFFMLSQPLPRIGALVAATVLEALVEAGLILVLGLHLVPPAPATVLALGIGNGLVGIVIYGLAAKLE